MLLLHSCFHFLKLVQLPKQLLQVQLQQRELLFAYFVVEYRRGGASMRSLWFKMMGLLVVYRVRVVT